MSTDSATNPNRSKRTRIDPTARPFETEQATTEQKAPKALALAFVKSHIASLQPKVATILEKLGTNHINLLSKKFQKTSQIEKMETNSDFIPRSARISFELHMTADAAATQEFQTLQTNTNNKVTEFRLFLKNQIIEATKIETKILTQQIQDNFITSLRHVITVFLTANSIAPTSDAIKTITKAVIEDTSIFTHSELTHDSFLLRASQINNEPLENNPTPMDHSDSLVIQGYTPYQIGPATQEAIQPPNLSPNLTAVAQTTKQAFKSIFVMAWDQYLEQTKKNKVNHELSKLQVSVLDDPATQRAASIVANEASVDAKTLKNIVVAHTKAETKHLTNQLKQLTNRINQLQKNDQPRSRGRSSSPKQPATNNPRNSQPQHHRRPQQQQTRTNHPSQHNRHQARTNQTKSSPSQSPVRQRNQSNRHNLNNVADASNNASRKNRRNSNNSNSTRNSNKPRQNSTTRRSNRSNSSNRN